MGTWLRQMVSGTCRVCIYVHVCVCMCGVGKRKGCGWRAEGEGRDEARDGSRGQTRQCLSGHVKDFDFHIKNT